MYYAFKKPYFTRDGETLVGVRKDETDKFVFEGFRHDVKPCLCCSETTPFELDSCDLSHLDYQDMFVDIIEELCNYESNCSR